ncbi:hypothetical protein F511_43929 [Dorcoceras hygrometricum]|uniref:Uncharacterized protein n=1 Tax=Dorcoceras hygrometricum TaxID=472368 RepID=A0A2Z7C7S8_9LAMI|nr:hypothetical protein F511_43929 [Dorcoceras hygrometricum]
MAKSISVKAGSFNALTVEKFSLLTAVVCGIRMNWASILFNILKKMVTAGSKQAKGFTVQISLLLESIPNLELGESSEFPASKILTEKTVHRFFSLNDKVEFPASKILTEKTVHRFVSLNDKVGAEEAAGAPKPKAASKKRPAADVGAPVAKNKRTMRKKSSSSTDNLDIVSVAQEAVPIQMIEPLTVALAAEDIFDQPAGETDGVKAVAADVDATAEKIDEQVAEPSDDVETSVGESFEPAVEVPDEETRPSSADDVDFIIQQVIEDTALMGPVEENQEVDASADRDQPASTTEERHWSLSVVEPVFRVAPRQSPVFALRVSQFCSVFIDFSLFGWLPTADITYFLSSIALDRTVFRDVQISQNTVSVAPSVQMLDEPSSSDSSSDDILMDFADQDTAAAANSLPAATTLDVTNALNQLRASIDQIRERDDDGAKTKDTLLLHLSNFENHVIARLDAQDMVLGALRKASNDQCNLLSLELHTSHKQLGTQIVTTGLDVVDIRRVVKETHQELHAKIHSLDEQVAATRNDLLEFSAQAQQSLNVITTQLRELVAYINRGGDDKKGESSSSRRPLPTPVHQSEGTGDAVRITEPTQADIDNANRAILERIRNEDSLHAERERDRARRERRLSRSGAYKRRRGY